MQICFMEKKLVDIIHIQFQQYQVLGITYTYKYLSSDFGSGKENTRKLIEKWNAFSHEIGIWNGNYSSRSSYCYNIKNGNVALEILLQIGCILLEVYIVMAQLENIMIVFLYV